MAIFMSQFEDQNVAIELHLRAGATYRALGDRYREGNSYADASINFGEWSGSCVDTSHHHLSATILYPRSERQGDKHRAASYKNRGFAMMLTENRKDGGGDLVGFTTALNSHEER